MHYSSRIRTLKTFCFFYDRVILMTDTAFFILRFHTIYMHLCVLAVICLDVNTCN